MNKAGTSFGTDVAVGSELMQAVNTASSASGNDVPMAGFGAGVHQYLNQLLTLIYSKTTTLLAANMVLTSLLLSTRLSHGWQGLIYFYVAAVCFFACSAITSTIVLFPRLHHHDANGLIFWRAILQKTPEQYEASIQSLNKETVEEEYAKDNWHISRTLRYKDALLRCAITLFICGMICAVIGVVGPAVFTKL